METILETILTNAGFAGALLAVCGWALWKKDRQVKDLQAAAVAREKAHAKALGTLAGEFTEKLSTLAEARTTDAHRYGGELLEMKDRDNSTWMAINTTLTEVKGVLENVRHDVSRRNSSVSAAPKDGG